MGWKSEHGADYEVPVEVTERLVDVSWHNDACPSFEAPDADQESPVQVRLWVEHPDPERRESGTAGRFVVDRFDWDATDVEQQDRVLYEGGDVAAAIAAVLEGSKR